MIGPTPPRAASRTGPLSYLGALALVGVANLAAMVVGQVGEGADVAMIFLAAVLVAGACFGLGPALVAAAAAILSYNLLFLEPRYSLAIRHPSDLLTFMVFLAVAGVTGWLAGRSRDRARLASERAEAVSRLLTASQRLSAAATREGAAQVLAEELARTADSAALVFLPAARGLVQAAGAPALAVLAPADLAAARLSWAQGVPSGAGTSEAPQAEWSFWPLEGLQGRTGVVAVAAARRFADRDSLLAAVVRQGAVALERTELAAGAAEADGLRRTDRLRSALLNSISHDLRTPLSAILGSTTTLIAYGAALEPEVRADLLQNVREQAERLNRYVGDLLDMTRVEGGALKPRGDMVDVRDVLASAARRVSDHLGGRTLAVDAPDGLSTVKTDPALLEQAVVNILENAIAYTPAGTSIELAAYEDRGTVALSIEDDGPGVPPDAVEHIFEKFHRMDGPTDREGRAVAGSGLGLAIAKGFVEALGGRIAASSPVGDGRGARFVISLPKVVATHEYFL